ncbi:MAG TPA: WxL domain-containing protein [Thermoleophilaceae bacterium]|nr:WxL domain-containing protein [Thermoleophilaceae bacterium]
MRLRSVPVLTTLAVVAAGAVGPAAAVAATDTTSVAIAAGSLDYTTPLTAGNFPATTLTGAQQTKSADISPYTVTDSRGGSAGWNLTVAASQFSSGTDTLPAGSLGMALAPVPTTTLGNLGVAPLPVATTAIDNGTTQKFVSAAAVPLGGAGAWTFSPPAGALTLTVPPAVAPGTYTSTITTTLATGP